MAESRHFMSHAAILAGWFLQFAMENERRVTNAADLRLLYVSAVDSARRPAFALSDPVLREPILVGLALEEA
jgi:hypothetical protein